MCVCVCVSCVCVDGWRGVLLMIESCVVCEGKLYNACCMSLAAVIVDRLLCLSV